MHVLVIGGTGLISTAITRQLVEEGHRVTCYNRGNTTDNTPDGVESLTGDRNDTERLAAQTAALEIDCVIDMVCFTPEQARDAVDVFANRVEQYIFCSTIDVYTRPLRRNPATEDAAREPAVSEYGANKAAAEDVFSSLPTEELSTTIIRPWSTYGEGGSVFHTLGSGTYYLDRVRNGKPIVVHGDGTSLWGACHRDDVAAAFVNAVGNRDAYGETYHVTSEEVITWNQYHHIVARALNAPEPELVHIPTADLIDAVPDRTEMLANHFQYSTVFDNSKAKRDLDFEYTISFETGVGQLIDWLDENDKITDWDSTNDDVLIDCWNRSRDQFSSKIDAQLQ